MQEHPLALFWLFHRPDAHPGLNARQTNCCLRYSSGLEGAGENDMVIVSVNQTLALPADVTSHLAIADQASGTWGGAGGGEAPGGPGLMCLWINQQFGHGRLTLASSDPDAHPLIDQDLLNVDADLVRARDGVKRSLDLLRSGSFDKAFARIAIDMTGRGLDELSDDAAIDAWLMETIGDTGHICGTCRMGAADDPRTVVDPEGRVLGVESLWVADASVFPAVPRANTNLPTIEAAERLSDLIRIRHLAQRSGGGECTRVIAAAEPLELRSVRLRNRLVATAHASGLVQDGLPVVGDAEYWGRLAKGGAAMLISGGTVTAPESSPRRGNILEAWRPEVVEPLRRRVDAIHAEDAVAVCQLVHLGRETLGRRELLLPHRAVGDPLATRVDRPAGDARARGRCHGRRLSRLGLPLPRGRLRRHRAPRRSRLSARAVPLAAYEPAAAMGWPSSGA